MIKFKSTIQAAHKITHRQHLIEEAKKAYAAKLVADKAGGPEAGKSIFDFWGMPLGPSVGLHDDIGAATL